MVKLADPVADLLRSVRVDGADLLTVTARNSRRIDAHSVSFHLVTAGKCFVTLDGEKRIELVAGDILVFPHGDAHVISSGSVTASLVCGFLGGDHRPLNPLLTALPSRIHMHGMSNEWLASFTRQLAEESSRGSFGADTVLTRLAELMLVEVVRRYLDSLPSDRAGWLSGLGDNVVNRVLTLVHERPAHPWNLADLARESASSRSSLTRRFTQRVGQPPMQYLAQLRMQLASNLLEQTGAKVATIGTEVGYDSEAAFSRAFKKATTLAPGAWRQARSAASSRASRVIPSERQRRESREAASREIRQATI